MLEIYTLECIAVLTSSEEPEKRKVDKAQELVCWWQPVDELGSFLETDMTLDYGLECGQSPQLAISLTLSAPIRPWQVGGLLRSCDMD